MQHYYDHQDRVSNASLVTTSGAAILDSLPSLPFLDYKSNLACNANTIGLTL